MREEELVELMEAARAEKARAEAQVRNAILLSAALLGNCPVCGRSVRYLTQHPTRMEVGLVCKSCGKINFSYYRGTISVEHPVIKMAFLNKVRAEALRIDGLSSNSKGVAEAAIPHAIDALGFASRRFFDVNEAQERSEGSVPGSGTKGPRAAHELREEG